MPAPATVVFPTRGRRDYLAVALASVAAQARSAGAEVLVVEDDAADPRTEALASEHGARYLAHGSTRGLNAARNTAIEASAAELVCFLDDDVEAWPQWLEAMPEGARRHPGHAVYGGPIRARLEGGDLHACGREPPPVTTLDLGAEDGPAEFAWGANLAVRRSAIERYGRFDAALDLYGDEEEWQRRLREQGGTVFYVARAGVDHRRAGADARLAGLARAAYRRGRNSRRYDMRKGTAPGLAREARTFAGCVVHAGRYRCGNGIVMAAHSAGRIAEALSPAQPRLDLLPDYVSGESGTLNRRTTLTGIARDLVTELALAPRRVALHRAAKASPRRRVLAIAVARPERAGSAATAGRELEGSHHEVAVRIAAAHPGAGKWQNLNAALAASPPAGFDWLLVLDDDVVLSRGFLDTFLFLAERFDLTIAQPAHKHWSNAAWRVTRRRPDTVVRETRFVEIGPVTAIHRRAFDVLLPFPDLYMGWGLDAHWGAVAAQHGWRMGVVDATPVRHTKPVAADYPRERAEAEAAAFLADRPYVTREQAQEIVAAHRTW